MTTRFTARNPITGMIIEVLDEGKEYYIGYPVNRSMVEDGSCVMQAYAKSAFEKTPRVERGDVA